MEHTNTNSLSSALNLNNCSALGKQQIWLPGWLNFSLSLSLSLAYSLARLLCHTSAHTQLGAHKDCEDWLARGKANSRFARADPTRAAALGLRAAAAPAREPGRVRGQRGPMEP